MNSLDGQLLIASPHLPDPNFYRSVVLIVEHESDGALGLVLNRVGTSRLEDVWQSACDSKCVMRDQLRVGGPVEGPLMVLHVESDLEGYEVVPGVFFSTERDVLEALVARDDSICRIFSGYSGWGSGQLDQEMRVGGWLTMKADARHIFEIEEETLWDTVTSSIGEEITRSALGLKHIPSDPTCN
ncbi:MAG: YqgE/AlgH family protein [Pirellulaceae bacterium]|nr:YqgE/AlgH family protein [Pirellulaceae bacterium]